LCDFSVAVALTDGEQMLGDQIGTSVFMAPEVSTRSYLAKPPDMWSLGITVFSLLFGQFPFNLNHFFDHCEIPAHVRVVDNVMGYDLEFPSRRAIPDELKSILGWLLEKDPEMRMTADELAREEWLHEELSEWEILTELLCGDGSV
jgi:serine/threonine protein kinase